MQEGYAFAFGAHARSLVDQRDTRRAAARERRVDVVDGKADVVDPGTSLVEELRDGRARVPRFEEFDQRVTSGQAGYAGAVAVVEGRVAQAEHVAVEGEQFVDAFYGDADVGDAGWGHAVNGSATGVATGPTGTIDSFTVGECGTMANAIAVTDSDFESQVEKHTGVVVVDFWATWCGPCRMIAPILEQLAVEYEGKVKVTKLDVDNNQKTGMRFNVRSIPTLLFFKDGKLVDQVIGAVPKAQLAAKFDQYAA